MSGEPLAAMHAGAAPGPRAPRFRTVLLVLAICLCAQLAPLAALGMTGRRPDLAVVLIAMTGAGVLLAIRPAWIVPAYVALTWTAIGGSQLGGFSPVELGGLALLALAAARALSRREVAADALTVVVLLALPLLAAGLLSAERPGVPVGHLRELAFILIVALGLRGAGDVARTARGFAAVGIFLGIGAVHSVLVHPTALFTLQPEAEGFAPRAAGPFNEANFFALSMAAILPFALYVASGRGAARLLGYAGALCLVAGVLATGSRGGLVASVCGVLVFGLWARQRQLLWTTLGVVVVAGLALAPLFAAQVVGSTERPVSGRAQEQRIAIEMFADHPIAGVGPGAYPDLFRDYARRVAGDARPVRTPHSVPLEIASEQGLVGLLGWIVAGVVLVGAARRRGVTRSTIGKAAMTGLLVYGVGSLALHGSQLRFPYILVGIILAFEPVPRPAKARR